MSEYNYELDNDGNEAQASQESQLDEQQLEEIIREAEQEGTKMVTKWAMKKNQQLARKEKHQHKPVSRSQPGTCKSPPDILR